MQKTITFRDPEIWVNNNAIMTTKPAGSSYADVIGQYNGGGARIAIADMVDVPAEDFTVSVAEGFIVALLGFDAERRYLGRDDGYVGMLPWTSGNEGAVADIHTSAAYMAILIRRSSSGILLARDVAEASLAITYEDENMFGGGWNYD